MRYNGDGVHRKAGTSLCFGQGQRYTVHSRAVAPTGPELDCVGHVTNDHALFGGHIGPWSHPSALALALVAAHVRQVDLKTPDAVRFHKKKCDRAVVGMCPRADHLAVVGGLGHWRRRIMKEPEAVELSVVALGEVVFR